MLEGTVVGGRYTILRLLGEGGMGAVYEARHFGTGRKVALKVISPELAGNRSIVQRLEAEAQAAGAIVSDHVTQVMDVGRDDATETPYLVMELLAGEDLGALLERVGPLEPMVAARIGVQIALGLEAAHACGIVHRDLKPANLFLSERDGGEVRVKILDFGIAKSLDLDSSRPNSKKLTKTGMIIGSPVYMSPEQARAAKDLDHRSDLWSFGVVLYELLSGATPIEPSDAIGSMVVDICTKPPAPLGERAPWVPRALADVVGRALEMDRGARWQSASEMRSALEAFVGDVRPLRKTEIVGAERGAAAPGTARASGPETAAAARTPPSVEPSELRGSAGAAAAAAPGARADAGTLPSNALPSNRENAPGGPSPAIAVMKAPPADPVRAAQIASAATRASGAEQPAQAATTTPQRVATQLYEPPVSTEKPAPIIAVTPARAQSGRGPVWALVGAGAIAAVGAIGYFVSRKGGEPSSPVATAPETSAPAAAQASAVVPAATHEVPSSAAVPAAPAALRELVGAWRSSSGRLYDAELSGDELEFRIRNASDFPDQGYAAREPRFSLSIAAGPGTFAVVDHLRPAAMNGAYAGGVGPDSCVVHARAAGGAPLEAHRKGDALVVAMASMAPPSTVFVGNGKTIERCVGLDLVKLDRVETTYTREPAR